MRRSFLLIYPVLLCALALSGWGGVLAVALCPHAAAQAGAAASATETMSMDKDHACCHADEKGAKEHCSNSSQEAMGEAKAKPVTEPSSQALAPSEGSCSHCISHSSLPVAPVKASKPAQHKSDAHGPAQDEAKPVAAPVVRFVSTIAPTQGAPPGPSARKHLLLSIFLI